MKQRDNEVKKDSAIKDQKIQFLEMQLEDCKSQLEDAYRQHEQMVKAMKTESSIDEGEHDGSPDMESLHQELDRVKAENTLQVYELKQ